MNANLDSRGKATSTRRQLNRIFWLTKYGLILWKVFSYRLRWRLDGFAVECSYTDVGRCSLPRSSRYSAQGTSSTEDKAGDNDGISCSSRQGDAERRRRSTSAAAELWSLRQRARYVIWFTVQTQDGVYNRPTAIYTGGTHTHSPEVTFIWPDLIRRTGLWTRPEAQ